MTDHQALSPEERNARQALQALSQTPADPDFRDRLRRAFAGGSIRPGLPDLVVEEGMTAPGRRAVRIPWFAARPVQVGIAVAAVLVVVTVWVLNRPAEWTVSGASGEGIAVIDGRPIPMNHREDLTAAIRPGARVRVAEGTELEIMNAGNLIIQITAGTDATVPGAPGRWFGRNIRGTMDAGQLRITTGPSFRGARLVIVSPEAKVEVTGTTLAVIRESHGTCVCVLEGRVRVGPEGGGMAEVEPGHLRFVFNDGRPPGTDDMRPIEREKLGMLKESRGSRLAR